MPRPEPSLNNPYELGADDFDLLREALGELELTAIGRKKNNVHNLLNLVNDSHAIWLDLNEEPDER